MREHETTMEVTEHAETVAYRAVCVCGWDGSMRPARFMAADDASRHHRLVVTAEPGGSIEEHGWSAEPHGSIRNNEH